MSPEPLLEPNVEQYLARSLSNGHAILFTGAGFSTGAQNTFGRPIPTGAQLKKLLWEAGFPSNDFDERSELGDIFDAAISTNPGRTEKILQDNLTVDSATLPRWYETYFQIPWYRMYTLNVDTLSEVCASKFDLPYDLKSTSALRDPLPPLGDFSLIHLNGRLRHFPEMTFSQSQYGVRTANFDLAYDALSREIYSHPVVFVGTNLDEPSLWQYLALRGESPATHELRPRSFLVSPSIPISKAAALSRYHIMHLPITTEQFAEQILAPVAATRPIRILSDSSRSSPYESVGLEMGEEPYSPPDFLLGREPSWGDITAGFAVLRAFETELFDQMETQDTHVTLLTGTAGSGKSTTARRLAISLQTSGKQVLWLKTDATGSVVDLKINALESDADFIFLDRCERFGESGIRLIRDLVESASPRNVVATFAGSAFDDFGVLQSLADLSPSHTLIPHLEDRDIELLIDALQRAGRLGVLSRLTGAERIRAFEFKAGRQLLVAMLEATSGRSFADKIDDECEHLASELTTAYAVIALATSNNHNLSRDDILASLSDVTVGGLESIERLVRQGLILKTRNGGFAGRHPVIARQVVAHYKNSGQLAEAVSRLAFVMASKYYAGCPVTPEIRLLRKLISHTYVGTIFDSVIQTREMYASLEGALREEPHYLLQRGSYELERGDPDLAENLLSQARGFAPDNYMIENEWGYLMMKKANKAPLDPDSKDRFSAAFSLMLDLIDRYGLRTPNTYVVLGEQTIDWAGRGPITWDEKRRLFEIVRTAFKNGARFHYSNRQFKATQERVEAVYLGLSLVK
jgi:energy-coupling factor transporter ATP-binding protein EcfA2